MICTGIEGPKKSIFAEKTIIERMTTVHESEGELATKVTWEVIHFERAQAKKTASITISNYLTLDGGRVKENRRASF